MHIFPTKLIVACDAPSASTDTLMEGVGTLAIEIAVAGQSGGSVFHTSTQLEPWQNLHDVAHFTRSLLIVDDFEPLRAALWEFFGESGYRARCAQDGVSALREIRQEVPDIVLSDLNMRGMSGFEFLSVVRHRFPAVRVVAMSGEFSGTGVPPGVDADAFFEKGADLGSLKRIV